MSTVKLIKILVVVFLASAVGLGLLLYFVWTDSTSPSDLEQKIIVEGAKSLMQLIVVILIGGGVAAIFKAFQYSSAVREGNEQRAREERKTRTDIRIHYLARVGKAYRNAKGTRRALRAGGITTKFGSGPEILSAKQLKIYEQQMLILDISQLELEALKIEAASLPDLLGLSGLIDLLASMEKYLRKVVQEYEKTSASIADGATTIIFRDLERLIEFSGATDTERADGFERRLASPHDKVIGLISKNGPNKT